MSIDCFGHTSLVTVKIAGAPPKSMHDMRRLRMEPFPCFLFLMFTSCKRHGPAPGSGWDLVVGLATLSSTTNPLTATALIYAFGAGITAGAGTRLVLQLLLDFGWI